MKSLKVLNKNKKGAVKVLVLALLMTLVLSSFAFASDPVDNVTTYAQERIGTIFLVIVAFGITKNFAKNATTKLFGFIIIAVVGGMLVYKPEFIQKGADWLFNILF